MDEPTDTRWVADPEGSVWTKQLSGGLWSCSDSLWEWSELDDEYGDDLAPLYPAPERPDDVPEWALHSDRWTWTKENGAARSRSTLNDVPAKDWYPGPPKPERSLTVERPLTETDVRERAAFYQAVVAEWDAEDAAKRGHPLWTANWGENAAKEQR